MKTKFNYQAVLDHLTGPVIENKVKVEDGFPCVFLSMMVLDGEVVSCSTFDEINPRVFLEKNVAELQGVIDLSMALMLEEGEPVTSGACVVIVRPSRMQMFEIGGEGGLGPQLSDRNTISVTMHRPGETVYGYIGFNDQGFAQKGGLIDMDLAFVTEGHAPPDADNSAPKTNTVH